MQKLIWVFMILIGIIYNQFHKLHYDKIKFNVIGFYTAESDLAHISFVNEAIPWFKQAAQKNNFRFESTNQWKNLNEEFLKNYQVVVFLDTRPENDSQRIAFQNYMDHGGAWLGFHFAGFALNKSKYEQNWPWYHESFLGVGQYKSNTWRPTTSILKTENMDHPVLNNIHHTFTSAPSEWYRWEKDLRPLSNFKILLSVDSSSFPLGTGPKPSEIWHSGYYPIAWTNSNYKMVYCNFGHNDMDYEGKTNKTLSSTFSSDEQNQFILNCLLWLGSSTRRDN